MGLYDAFILNDFLECPLCGAKEKARIKEFQTKELGQFFQCFKIGEKAILNDCFQLLDGKYPAYSSCDKCDAWIDANAVIEGGKFVRIEDIKAMTQEERWNNIGVGEC